MNKRRKRYSLSEREKVLLEILGEDSTVNEIAAKKHNDRIHFDEPAYGCSRIRKVLEKFGFFIGGIYLTLTDLDNHFEWGVHKAELRKQKPKTASIQLLAVFSFIDLY